MKDEADLEIRRRDGRVIVFAAVGLSVAVPFSSSVHSRFRQLARRGHPSTAV
jgi:hypothetical protein